MTQSDRVYDFIKSCGKPGPTSAEIQRHFNYQIQNFRARISDCRQHGKDIACDKAQKPARFYIPFKLEA